MISKPNSETKHSETKEYVKYQKTLSTITSFNNPFLDDKRIQKKTRTHVNFLHKYDNIRHPSFSA